MERLFLDRREAGRRLATLLMGYAARPGVVVLGLARGGVPVAYEVADALGAPLDVLTVKKLEVPGHAEVALGAIASGGACVLNRGLIDAYEVPGSYVERRRVLAEKELKRREVALRGRRPPIDVRGKTVIVVDDGLATGATMRAAVAALRQLRPARIVMAVAVAAPQALAALRAVADSCVCVAAPASFQSVSLWFDDFRQTEDSEVRALLDDALRRFPDNPGASDPVDDVRHEEHAAAHLEELVP